MVTPDENSLGSTNHSRDGDGEGRQPAIVLAPAVAVRVGNMGRQLGGVDASEVIRRGLILLDLYLSLDVDEELVIRNTTTDRIERLQFNWDQF